MSFDFDSLDGTTYNVEAGTTLTNWSVVKSVFGTGASTNVSLTKSELDAALGSFPRSKAFIRVSRP